MEKVWGLFLDGQIAAAWRDQGRIEPQLNLWVAQRRAERARVPNTLESNRMAPRSRRDLMLCRVIRTPGMCFPGPPVLRWCEMAETLSPLL